MVRGRREVGEQPGGEADEGAAGVPVDQGEAEHGEQQQVGDGAGQLEPGEHAHLDDQGDDDQGVDESRIRLTRIGQLLGARRPRRPGRFVLGPPSLAVGAGVAVTVTVGVGLGFSGLGRQHRVARVLARRLHDHTHDVELGEADVRPDLDGPGQVTTGAGPP